eukprot:2326245-Pleurochrysis_carterae.AAC.2
MHIWPARSHAYPRRAKGAAPAHCSHPYMRTRHELGHTHTIQKHARAAPLERQRNLRALQHKAAADAPALVRARRFAPLHKLEPCRTPSRTARPCGACRPA